MNTQVFVIENKLYTAEMKLDLVEDSLNFYYKSEKNAALIDDPYYKKIISERITEREKERKELLKTIDNLKQQL